MWRAARPRMPRTLRPSSGTHALTWPCPALAVHLLLPTLSGVVLPCLAYSKTTKHAILNHHVSFPLTPVHRLCAILGCCCCCGRQGKETLWKNGSDAWPSAQEEEALALRLPLLLYV